MLSKRLRGLCALGAAAGIAATVAAPAASAQRRQDWDWQGNYQRLSQLNAGTYLRVRITQSITSNRADGRIFTGVVAEDVWDDYRRLAVPAIPHGSPVELIVRTARDGDLILDLESVNAHGQRYVLDAAPERVDSNDSRHSDNRPEFVGGGAILGTIIGAIAGGGKGAAIGAAAGAATGLGLSYRGHSVKVPAGSVLNFRLDRPLIIGMPDNGYTRDRSHYHRDAGPDYLYRK